MNINAIIEEVTGEKGSYFVLSRDKIAEIVHRCKTDEYERGLKEGFARGKKVGYAQRSDEMYEQAIVGRFGQYNATME